MRPTATSPLAIDKSTARRIWLAAQRLDTPLPFGSGPAATTAAVEHLGYVQIDTINVIERCHHHILWNRIPDYRKSHLHQAQTIDKTVFEYWTHALSYVPTRDLRFFRSAMKSHGATPASWFASVTRKDLRRILKRIEVDGAVSIRDIDDDVLVEKDHPWASRKPSKRALQMAFYAGAVTVSERLGMLKTYELTGRHFGWDAPPRAATEREINAYLLDRALLSQGIVSLDSICHLEAGRKAAVRSVIEARVRRRALVPVSVEGAGRTDHWAKPETLEQPARTEGPLVHILSPFDPLVIQRKRLELFFGYGHVFEAYVPREKRRFGYFALPVLVGDEIVAAIDLKTDRDNRRLLVQKWTWVGEGAPERNAVEVEDALHRFEQFQLAP